MPTSPPETYGPTEKRTLCKYSKDYITERQKTEYIYYIYIHTYIYTYKYYIERLYIYMKSKSILYIERVDFV